MSHVSPATQRRRLKQVQRRFLYMLGQTGSRPVATESYTQIFYECDALET